MMDMSKQELQKALVRAKSSMARIRETSGEIAGRGISTGVAVASSAGFAMARKKFGAGTEKRLLIPGTQVDADLVYGTIAALVGISGAPGKHSDTLAASGAGALSGYTALKIVHG